MAQIAVGESLKCQIPKVEEILDTLEGSSSFSSVEEAVHAMAVVKVAFSGHRIVVNGLVREAIKNVRDIIVERTLRDIFADGKVPEDPRKAFLARAAEAHGVEEVSTQTKSALCLAQDKVYGNLYWKEVKRPRGPRKQAGAVEQCAHSEAEPEPHADQIVIYQDEGIVVTEAWEGQLHRRSVILLPGPRCTPYAGSNCCDDTDEEILGPRIISRGNIPVHSVIGRNRRAAQSPHGLWPRPLLMSDGRALHVV